VLETRIRSFDESTLARVPEITALLHRAYRPLADAGMRFYASHQDDAATLGRLRKGEAFLALRDETIVGTITFYPPGTNKGAPWYERHDVCGFGQWAVEPDLQRHGIGGRLLAHVERLGAESGASEIACDTSERATQLLTYYERRGYRRVGTVQWEVTNYRSIILSKGLR
jgi:predicted N-acetyltransferase YhbS